MVNKGSVIIILSLIFLNIHSNSTVGIEYEESFSYQELPDQEF